MFFIDNIYGEATENRVKHQMSGRGPEEWLYPKETTWITCKTHTSMSHRNKCGPRALLPGMIIALHPDPNEKTLEHLTHQELAKILQDFVVKSVLSGKIYMNALQGTHINEGQDATSRGRIT